MESLADIGERLETAVGRTLEQLAAPERDRVATVGEAVTRLGVALERFPQPLQAVAENDAPVAVEAATPIGDGEVNAAQAAVAAAYDAIDNQFTLAA